MTYYTSNLLRFLACALASLTLVACGVDDSVTVDTTSEAVGSSREPVANPDAASTVEGQEVVFSVLDNDTAEDIGAVSVSILTQAAHGALFLGLDNMVTYVPDASFTGTDSFLYQITDANGAISTAMVSISVDCGAISCTYPIQLSWSAGSTTDVSGYYVYHGEISGEYVEKVWVDGDTVAEFTVSGLGTHYFAVTAVSLSGIESSYSPEAVVVL